jgi:hypothetical protein
VVVLTAVLTLVTAGALEFAHRSEVTEWIGREPANWGASGPRAFATAWALGHHRGPVAEERWLRIAAESPTDPYVAAQACYHLSLRADSGSPSRAALNFARRAAEAAPADAPKLPAYYRALARQLEKAGRQAEVVPTLLGGLRRSATRELKAELLSTIMDRMIEQGRAAQALQVRETVRRSCPQALADEEVRACYADALTHVGRVRAARRIYVALAREARRQYIRDRACEALAAGKRARKSGH